MASLVPGQSDRPTGAICQVAATWKNDVLFTPDPTHGGNPIPGLAGRLYLFGPEMGTPLIGDGTLIVDLFDEANPKKDDNGNPTPLEEWRIDKETLRRLERRDVVGWGYTLFLPWATYKPEITQVHLKVCYQPAKGMPYYAYSSPMTLGDGDTKVGLEQVSYPPKPRS